MAIRNNCSTTSDASRANESDTSVDSSLDTENQDLVYQELPARITNPVKLVALLRMEFGIGRYDVSVSKEGKTTMQLPFGKARLPRKIGRDPQNSHCF